jgi:hypothetical protein
MLLQLVCLLRSNHVHASRNLYGALPSCRGTRHPEPHRLMIQYRRLNCYGCAEMRVSIILHGTNSDELIMCTRLILILTGINQHTFFLNPSKFYRICQTHYMLNEPISSRTQKFCPRGHMLLCCGPQDS